MKTWTGKHTLRAREMWGNLGSTGLISLVILSLLYLFLGLPSLPFLCSGLFISTWLLSQVIGCRLRLPWFFMTSQLVFIFSFGILMSYWEITPHPERETGIFDSLIIPCHIFLFLALPSWLFRKRILHWSRLRWQDLSADEQAALQQAMAKEQARDEQAKQKSRKNKQAI